MNIQTYITTVKGTHQDFVHVHLILNGDHHIVSINELLETFQVPSYMEIKQAVNTDDHPLRWFFQAHYKEFYSDYVYQSGNVIKCNHNMSTCLLYLGYINNVKSFVIKSTFNGNLIVTVLPINDKHEEFIEGINVIQDALVSGYRNWYCAYAERLFGI